MLHLYQTVSIIVKLIKCCIIPNIDSKIGNAILVPNSKYNTCSKIVNATLVSNSKYNSKIDYATLYQTLIVNLVMLN